MESFACPFTHTYTHIHTKIQSVRQENLEYKQNTRLVQRNNVTSVNRNRSISGLILGLRPANERRRYKVMLSLIGWAKT